MRLVAGAWTGEFGWELFCWQGYLRALAKELGVDRTLIICRRGNEALYSDFASEIINFETPLDESTMYLNGSHDARARIFDKGLLEPSDIYHNPKMTWDGIRGLKRGEEMVISLRPQEFISYGKARIWRDVLFHVRERKFWDSGFRNWPLDHAQAVASHFKGLRMASIGLSSSACHIPGTEDLRDVPLSALADVMAGARLIVGPMSGPSHFAALCRLPQVIWVTKKIHETRGLEWWNPFKVKVFCITSQDYVWRQRLAWIPPVEEIVEKMKVALGEAVEVSL